MLLETASSFDSSSTSCFDAEKNEVRLLPIDFAALLEAELSLASTKVHSSNLSFDKEAI